MLGSTGPVRRAGRPRRPIRGGPDRRPAQPSSSVACSSRRPTTSSASVTNSSATPSRTSCSVANGGGCTSGRSTYCASRWAPTSPTSPATPPVPASYDEMVELARDGVGHYLDIGATHQALRLAVAALAEAPDDVELLAGAARAAWLIGAHDEAWGHAERLLGLTDGEHSERRAAAVRLAARVAHERSDVDRMWQLVDEMQRLVDVLPPGEERAATMAAIAQINMLHDRSTDAIEWAERAIVEADSVGAKAVRAQAMVERAHRAHRTAGPACGGHRTSDRGRRRGRTARGLGAAGAGAAQPQQRDARCRAVAATSSECATPGGGPASTTWSPPTTTSASPKWPAARATHRRCGSTSRGSACTIEGGAGDWALALQVRLLLEVDRVDEAAGAARGLGPT